MARGLTKGSGRWTSVKLNCIKKLLVEQRALRERQVRTIKVAIPAFLVLSCATIWIPNTTQQIVVEEKANKAPIFIQLWTCGILSR